jgi:hypothetical protein
MHLKGKNMITRYPTSRPRITNRQLAIGALLLLAGAVSVFAGTRRLRRLEPPHQKIAR